MIGEKMPMLVTAVGRAYLSACDDAERRALLELLERRTDAWGELARDKRYVKRFIADTQRRGYAYNDGEWACEAAFAGIAVPVHSGERLLAALNMVFPKTKFELAINRRTAQALGLSIPHSLLVSADRLIE
jgi:IclR family transcriptional regulator, mhp operon transcriptional activator